MAEIFVKVKNKNERTAYLVDDFMYSELSKYKWCQDTYGYAVRRNDNIEIKTNKIILHRFVIGAKKGEIVDHINGDITDNRLCNLRICTKSQNAVNSKMRSNNKTGFRGVSIYYKNKYVAEIWKDNKKIKIGVFDNKTEAAIAYDKKAVELHGEFAKLNFPKELNGIG